MRTLQTLFALASLIRKLLFACAIFLRGRSAFRLTH